jgi:hypothetical protein
MAMAIDVASNRRATDERRCMEHTPQEIEAGNLPARSDDEAKTA